MMRDNGGKCDARARAWWKVTLVSEDKITELYFSIVAAMERENN